jgi:hypothetical protein
MSKKPKDIEVKVEDVKRNAGNTQIEVTQVSIGKQVLGFVVPVDGGKFDVEVNGKVESTVKTLDEGLEQLISEYNLQQ